MLNSIYNAAFFALVIVGFFFRKNNTESTSKTVDVWFCISAALIASTFFSLFPLSRAYPYADSSVFIYIGKMMQKGFLPYADLFDHKGILLYFIQFFGLSLTGGNMTGIWILEAINMIATSLILFQVTGLFTKDKMVRYLTLIAVLVMCGMKTYEGGNFTEEYALPWISLALYIFLKYFQNFEYRFSEIIWLGVSFAVVSLLRVNMAAIWIAVMPVILIRMICKRQGKDILNCALGFLAGMAIVYLPVLIYLFWTGSFKDFIDCYIVFNFGYSDGGSNWAAVSSAILKGLGNMPLAVAALVISLYPYIKNRLYMLNLWILAVSLYFSHMSGRFYQHYGMILLPLLAALFACAFTNIYDIVSLKEKIRFRLKFPNNGIMLAGLTVVIAGAFFLQFKWANLIHDALFTTDGMDIVQECILENTTEEDDVLIVGNDVKHYLLADRETENKYFYQTPPIKISEELCEDFLKEAREHPSDFIVVMGDKEDCLSREDLLGEAYAFFEEKCAAGEYECEVYENFYTYKLIK